MFSKQAWKVLTVRRVTGARGSDRRYENRFRNRHATKHERDHTDVQGYFWKIRHASSILYSLDIVSKWVIAHFQKRFWYWLEGGNCWKCWFNRRLFKRNLLIWTAERRDGNLKALRGVNEKSPCKRENSWLSIFKLRVNTWPYWSLQFIFLNGVNAEHHFPPKPQIFAHNSPLYHNDPQAVRKWKDDKVYL